MSRDSEWHKLEQQMASALDAWLYPNAQFRGHGGDDDLKFIHAQYATADSLEQVRAFYWKKCEWSLERTDGSILYGPIPQAFFQKRTAHDCGPCHRAAKHKHSCRSRRRPAKD